MVPLPWGKHEKYSYKCLNLARLDKIYINILNSMLLSLLTTLLTAACDAPEPWLLGFQDGASPSFEGIIELHHTIFFYLLVIGITVLWILGNIVISFVDTRAPIAHRYNNHGTLIEVVWTIVPAFILVAIAFPSFKLLYLMDL